MTAGVTMPFVVTLTGTGIPDPAPGRAGPGVLVEVAGKSLQFDAGRATVLRLVEAGSGPEQLDALFLTHHHSDHCSGLVDLVLTRWVRRAPDLTIVAPDGPLTRFGSRFLDAWDDDIAVRREVTGRPALAVDWRPFTGSREPEVVWASDGVEVSAVLVEHAPVESAVAYRVAHAGRSVVISGDTIVCPAVEEMAEGADLLVHEAALAQGADHGVAKAVFDYHADPRELGALAERAGVRKLMLTHLLPPPATDAEEAAFRAAVREGGFRGELVVGHDLITHTIGEAG